jgi:endogenous inhibitor of DNA gyrase (YacG/DUF329 family)
VYGNSEMTNTCPFCSVTYPIKYTYEKVRRIFCSRRCANRNQIAKRLPHQQPHWKGGKTVASNGYVMIRVGRHYVGEHRLIMEKQIGRKLTHGEVVHHINGNKQDNRLENLILMQNAAHTTQHLLEIPKRPCAFCGKAFRSRRGDARFCSQKCWGKRKHIKLSI